MSHSSGRWVRIVVAGAFGVAGFAFASNALRAESTCRVTPKATGGSAAAAAGALDGIGEVSAIRPADAERFISDPAALMRLAEACDRTSVPTILRWLGAEQDRTRVGSGGLRLRVAMAAAERLRLKEAVPYLIAIYDAPTASIQMKNLAVFGAARIAPDFSKSFLEEVLADDHLAFEGYERSAHFAAAAALAELGGEKGRDFLVEAYRGYLETLPPLDAAPDARPVKRMNSGAVLMMIRVADAKLAERVATLPEEYTAANQRDHIKTVLRHLRTNLLPIDELFKQAETDPPTDGDFKKIEDAADQQIAAIVAIAYHGGPEVLPRLRELERRLAADVERDPASREAATQPTTQAGVLGDLGATSHSPARRRIDALNAVRDYGRVLYARHALPVPGQPATAPASRPTSRESAGPTRAAAAAIPQAVDADFRAAAEPRRVTGLGSFNSGGTMSVVVELGDVSGHRQPLRLAVMDRETAERLQKLPPETVVLFTKSDDGRKLERFEPLNTAPGETSPDGYVFVETRKVKSGEWEHLAAVLRKYGRETVARIPNRTAADGSSVSERRLAGRVAMLHPGDVVEARMEDVAGLTMLTSIDRYDPSLPGEFVRLTTVKSADGEQRPAVELRVGRKLRTWALPPADADEPPLLTDEMLDEMRPGFRVRFVPGATPADPLRALWIDGYRYRDEKHFLAFSGRASLEGEERNGERNGFLATTGRDGEGSRLQQGANRLINGERPLPEGFAPERLELLREVLRTRPAVYVRPDAAKAKCMDLYERADAAPSEHARRQAEQQMYLVLQQVTDHLVRAEQEQIKAAREGLSDAEYQAVLDVGRINPKPLLRPKNPTSPATPKPPETKPAPERINESD